ncbi:MAG: helix-turn-helix transcriptional regulator [Ignavibacteriae bacterium]|nr:helix-turn-helix transcriptional regulator [Ignavibacteriota bacterium]
MTLGARINLFIHCCNQSQHNFANYIAINRGYLNRIINDKISPGVEILSKFVAAGLSVDWLIEGKGSMFADNKTGNELKLKIINEGLGSNSLGSRLLSWICREHDNPESFCNKFSIDYDRYFRMIFDSAIPDMEFINTIKSAGCNITWLYTGKGPQNLMHPNGVAAKSRKAVQDINTDGEFE